jgi:hypothetical protein
MTKKQTFLFKTLTLLMGVLAIACGGAPAPAPETAEDDEDFDLVGSIVGEVEIAEEEDLDDNGETAEEYSGPTQLTVNLKVVNEKNPEGSSYRLLDASGKALIENGSVGAETVLNQGNYSIEFKSSKVFGDRTYLVEDVEVIGKKLSIDSVFPAGQITLHSFRGKKEKRCVPTKFTVQMLVEEKQVKLPGKGQTCEPLILETGTYEVLLSISRKKVQPVKLQINSGQVASAKVKLDY